jgi:hypothetical protein
LAPVEFIERDGFAFVASDAEVQFRAKSNKTQQMTQHKQVLTSEISPHLAGSSVDADATLAFAAFAPDAKPPAFQDTKSSSRSACADLQAASQSLSEVLKQVDAVLSQSAASPIATAVQVTLPSPSLRRVSVSNIVSTFEQNKVSPPVVISARENKRTSFPPPTQEAERTSDSLLQNPKAPTEVELQTSPSSDWTIVNSPANATALKIICGVDDTVICAPILQQQSPSVLPTSFEDAVIDAASVAVDKQHSITRSSPSNQHVASETISVHISPKAVSVIDRFTPECDPATEAKSHASNVPVATAVAQPEQVLVQISSAAQNQILATAGPIKAPVPPAGARYTFEDVERITTFAKEELQRRADAEVAALTMQLATQASQTKALGDENAVLKDTLLQ